MKILSQDIYFENSLHSSQFFMVSLQHISIQRCYNVSRNLIELTQVFPSDLSGIVVMEKERTILKQRLFLKSNTNKMENHT